MTYIALLDDCKFQWNGISPTPEAAQLRTVSPCQSPPKDLEEWFWLWAKERKSTFESSRIGVFLIHAHACFSPDAHRQDMQGVELLKHIRLTPWIGASRCWHAIVYSFEPLEQVLQRRPENLILKSPGVTFLRLPEALELASALRRAYPAKSWNGVELNGILNDLATNHQATPDARSFRPFVAADYHPPDSAHQISNWWGVYELWGAISGCEYPEFEKPETIPPQILPLVLRLDTKKARWLEGGRSFSLRQELSPSAFSSALKQLVETARNKKIAYVDDEAGKGWLDLLNSLLNENVSPPARTIFLPDPSNLQLPDKARDTSKYQKSVKSLSRWVVNQVKPDLLVLDLRLLGSREAFKDPMQASGMDLAREVRRRNPYLPILLFTASNKAETLLVSRSLDVDDYWMKPGLGEHRGLGTREEGLTALVEKLTTLLGPDYQWLQRAAGAVRSIEQSKQNKQLWWQKEYEWPGPNGNQDMKDVQPPPDVSIVVKLLHAILYTVRMLFRFRQVFGGAAGENHSRYVPPQMVPRILTSAIFNHIGQAIELVHDVTEVNKDPFGGKTGNARIGGYFDSSMNQFVFRRCDWWAFRLLALRNRYSHAGDATRVECDEKVKEAISDLLAWLMITPPQKTSQNDMFRLDPQDNRQYLRGPSGRDAEDPRFRKLLVDCGYNSLAERSKEIQRGAP